MKIVFEWDSKRAASNARKHGVSFETATLVFRDANFLAAIQFDAEGEQRWQTIGLVNGILMLVVIHTTFDTDQVDTIRIISARRATPQERARYERENGSNYR